MKDLLLIYSAIYILFFLINRRCNKVFLLNVLLYISASFAAWYIYDIFFLGDTIYISAVLYHILMTLLLLIPLKYIDLKHSYINITPYSVVKYLAYIIIFLSFISIILDVPKINFARMMVHIHSIREEMQDGAFNINNPILNYLSYWGGKYWSVALALAFYYMSYYPNKRKTIICLIIASLSCVISGFVVGAREYLMKYIYIFIILLYCFNTRLANKWSKIIKVCFVVFTSLFCFIFLLITFLRFSENNNTLTESMLSYFGEGNIYFSQYFNEFPQGLADGKIRFPIFAGGMISPYRLDERFVVNTPLNIFPTTIGSWVLDVGVYLTIIVTLIHYFVFKHVAQRKMTIFNIIYIVWIYEFIFSSLFFYNEVLNTSRLLSILFIIFLDYLSKKNVKSFT